MMFCPCRSGDAYEACCGRFHQGEIPPSAVTLMRSRYSAYALHKVVYIMETTHPENPQYQKNLEQWEKEILAFCLSTEFVGLDILEVEEGLEEAYVTFFAHLLQKEKNVSFKEKSRFEKTEGRWMPRDICSRGRYLNREGVKNPCLV